MNLGINTLEDLVLAVAQLNGMPLDTPIHFALDDSDPTASYVGLYAGDMDEEPFGNAKLEWWHGSAPVGRVLDTGEWPYVTQLASALERAGDTAEVFARSNGATVQLVVDDKPVAELRRH